MYPRWHILYGFIFSLILYYFFEFSILASLIVFLSSFLFDVDHYLNYVIKKKDLNLRKAYLWNIKESYKLRALSKKQKKESKIQFFLFHGIEFLIVLIVLSYFNVLFFWIFLGVLIHGILDQIHTVYVNNLWYSKFSEIHILVRNKNKKEI